MAEKKKALAKKPAPKVLYRVVSSFKDLKDDDHIYLVGEEFPRKGKRPSQERIDELLGSDNKQGRPVIEKITVAD